MASIINATTTNGVAVQGDNSGSLQLQTNNGTTAVTIDTSQNVGIGTSSPATKLDVSGAASATPVTNGIIRILTTGSNPPTGNGGGLLFAQVNSGGTNQNYASITGSRVDSTANNKVDLVFATGDPTGSVAIAERMRIDTSGNLLVGRTSSSYGGLITAQFTAQTQVGLTLVDTYTSYSGTNYVVFVNSSGGTAGTIAHNGATTVAYNTSSDYRMKENVQPMTGALNKVALLKPVTYKWKEEFGGEDGQGFIAHELADICPQAVSGEKDAVNEDGSIKAQGIDTSFLVATLTAAIQEQQAQIEELKAEVQALKGVK